MRRYRRQGVGKRVAFAVFDRFPGRWEVRQIQANLPGQRFWKDVIAEYTRNRFEETVLDNEAWRGPVQSFDSAV